MSQLLDLARRALVTPVRRWWGLLVLIGAVLAAAYLGRDIPKYPANQVDAYRNVPAIATALATVEPKDRLAAERDLLQYQTDNEIKIWTGIVQGLAAVVLAIGGYFTWRNLRVAQEGQITNRFTQAIDQLGAEKDGKPNLEARLGGIYALERIARDSPRDHWTIMEILTAYVRENAHWVELSPSDGVVSSPENVPPEQPQEVQEPPRLRTDIQAILTVIGRRVRSDDRREGQLDLHQTDLRSAQLENAHLEGTNLTEAHLEHAWLRGAHLENALLGGAHLEKAWLGSAHLTPAHLGRAHLEGANLSLAHLEHAWLSGAYLERAVLGGTHLEHAVLSGALLERASLEKAHLEGALLSEAHLERAYLRDAYLERTYLRDAYVEQAQVYSAYAHGKGALLPDHWPATWRDDVQRSSETGASNAPTTHDSSTVG